MTAPDPWRARALLFDLDGVLVDSREAIELVWRRWAAQQGLEADAFLRVAHGRRISETIRAVAPALDAAAAAAQLDRLEAVQTTGLHPVAGARSLLRSLPEGAWAIVTSGSRDVASLRLRSVGLPQPRVFVTGDLVHPGKPAPGPYLLAAERLGAAPEDCVVVEDAPPGVAAGRAAGMRVIAVLTTHDGAALAAADRRLQSLSDLRVSAGTSGWLTIEIPRHRPT
jgi:mannitol-1-/sugar-/sorbitol-6-phosphatase